MTDLPDEDTIRVRRTGGATRGRPEDPAPSLRRETFTDEAADDEDDDPTDGSTIVARRESRRRVAREQAGPATTAPAATERIPPRDEPASTGRRAAVPDAAPGVRYGVRGAEPVVVPRAAPPERTPQPLIDVEASAATRRRRARRNAVIVVVGVSAAAVGAIAALIVILVNP